MTDKEKVSEEEAKSKTKEPNPDEEEKYQGGPIPRVTPPEEKKE